MYITYNNIHYTYIDTIHVFKSECRAMISIFV